MSADSMLQCQSCQARPRLLKTISHLGVICAQQLVGPIVIKKHATYMRLQACKSNLWFLEVCLQYSGEHLLQDSWCLQALVLLAPEGEAASEHAVQQDATRPDVRHLASILVVQQHLWRNILRSACRPAMYRLTPRLNLGLKHCPALAAVQCCIA